MTEPNNLYYFYSTIAQVLAGVIAMLGAFWIYGNENINKKLKSAGKTLLIEMGAPILGEINVSDSAKDEHRKMVMNGLIESGDINGKKFTYDNAKFWVKRLSVRMYSSFEQDDFKWIENAIKTVDKHLKTSTSKKLVTHFELIQTDKIKFKKITIQSIIFSVTTIFFSVVTLPFAREISLNSILMWTCFLVIGLLYFSQYLLY